MNSSFPFGVFLSPVCLSTLTSLKISDNGGGGGCRPDQDAVSTDEERLLLLLLLPPEETKKNRKSVHSDVQKKREPDARTDDWLLSVNRLRCKQATLLFQKEITTTGASALSHALYCLATAASASSARNSIEKNGTKFVGK